MPRIATTLDDGVTSAQLGDPLTYTVTPQNTQANTTAAGATIALTLPANLLVTDARGGAVDGNTVTSTFSDLVGGQPLTKSVATQLQSGTPTPSRPRRRHRPWSTSRTRASGPARPAG